jgi:glycopeptide antibiotics resistance protein
VFLTRFSSQAANSFADIELLSNKVNSVLRPTTFSIRWKWWLFVAATTTWLLLMTLRPDGHISAHDVNLTPLAEHSRALVCFLDQRCSFQRQAFWFLLINLVGNILVFVPLGFGLAGALYQGRVKQIIWQAALGGFILSLAIELLQLTTLSRSTDVDDLIFNTLGAALGASLYAVFKIYFTRSRHELTCTTENENVQRSNVQRSNVISEGD